MNLAERISIIFCILLVLINLGCTEQEVESLSSELDSIESVEFSKGVLNPSFDPSVKNYTLNLKFLNQSVKVTATSSDPQLSLKIGEQTLTSGVESSAFKVAPGSDSTIELVSEKEGTSTTYSIQVIRASAAEFAQEAYVKASNTGDDDFFGASVSLYGDTMAISGSGDDSCATGIDGDQTNTGCADSGAVYVFVRSNNTWVQQAYIKASNTKANDFFGEKVSLFEDVLVVGSANEASCASGIDGDESNTGCALAGAVYIFRRSGTTWQQEAYVKPSATTGNDFFSTDLEIYGNTLVVGAEGEDSCATGINGNDSDNSCSNSGAAYVFYYDGSNWSQQAYLKASNSAASDAFGGSVSIYDNDIVVGSYGEDSCATGINGDESNNACSDSGAAYVFKRDGTTWAQEAYLKASNTGVGDSFASVVEVEKESLIAGAIGEDSCATGIDGDQSNNVCADAGAVYVFDRTGSTWSQSSYLKASNTETGDFFGSWVDIYDDMLVVNSEWEASCATGINGDQSDNSCVDTGSVYLFNRSESAWSQHAYIKASNTESDESFGFLGIAISEEYLIVGASYEESCATGINGDQSDNSCDSAGAGYLFH